MADLNLQYNPIIETEASTAIDKELIEPLDLTGLPIEVAVANIDQVSNDEYILLRRQGIGASEAGIITGVNPYEKIEDLIKAKVSTTISAEERAVGTNIAVMKGRDLEPLIIAKSQRYFETGINKPPHMYRHTEYPFLTVNFDGVIGAPQDYKPFEIKVVTVNGLRHYRPNVAMFIEGVGFRPIPEDVSGKNFSIQTKAAHYGIPPYYYTQMQHQMLCLNAPYGYLSTLSEKTWQVFTYYIPRDEACIKDIIVNGYRVWQQIEALRGSKL